jgi:hypothetical protein
MFGYRHRLHRLSRVHPWADLAGWSSYAMPFGGAFVPGFRSRYRRGFRAMGRRQRRGPSAFKILLAGLAVFALVRLMSQDSQRTRTTGEKLVIGVLVAGLAAMLLSLRRSTARYRWS